MRAAIKLTQDDSAKAKPKASSKAKGKAKAKSKSNSKTKETDAPPEEIDPGAAELAAEDAEIKAEQEMPEEPVVSKGRGRGRGRGAPKKRPGANDNTSSKRSRRSNKDH